MQKKHLPIWLKHKAVKITGYILLCLTAIITIALISAAVYIHYNKPAIINKVKEAFAKNVNGQLQIGNMDVSLWARFPNITVTLDNITIADSLNHSPLLKAQSISCSISPFQLAASKPTLEKLKVIHGALHLFIDSAGFDNSYILSPKKAPSSNSNDTSSQSFIHIIELDDVRFISEQALNNKKFEVLVNSAYANITRQDSLLVISAEENCLIKGLGFNLSNGIFLENIPVKGRWQLQFNTLSKTLHSPVNSVFINNSNFDISADFSFKDSGRFNLNASAGNISYQNAKEIVTQKIQNKLSFLSISQLIKVTALLKGQLKNGGDPQVYVTCTARNNTLQTKLTRFDNCNFVGIYTNQLNPKQKPSDPNSIVYFNRFTGRWSGLEMVGDSIRIDNLSTPSFFFNFHSACSFQQLDSALNLKAINFDEGAATLNLQYKGPLAVDATIFANLTGGLQFTNGKITYLPHNLQFEHCNGNITFSKNSMVIKKITCNYKKNRFEVTGTGNSINSALMATGKSSIACNIYCPSFNASDFKSVFANNSNTIKAKNNTNALGNTTGTLDNILEKGDIELNITAAELLLNNFVAQDARVVLLLQQNNWQVQRASLNFGGGSFFVDANVFRSGNNFVADAKLDIKNADVRKAFYAFNNFGQEAITYQNLRGSLNAGGNLHMLLNNTGSIVPGSMQGTATFSIQNGALINFKPLTNLQEYVFKNRDMTNVAFAEIKNNLTIKQNQVLIPRMEIASTAMRIFIEGVYGVDTATDISIQVPFSNLSKPADVAPINKGTDVKAGPSLYLRAKSRADGKVKIGLDLFRKFRKNKTLE
jgi:hypothetical protein